MTTEGSIISFVAADCLTSSKWLVTSRVLVTDPVCVSDLGVYVEPKGGLESLLCKESFVVVACGRVVQDRADFSSR